MKKIFLFCAAVAFSASAAFSQCEAGVADFSATESSVCPAVSTELTVTGITIPAGGGAAVQFTPVPGSGAGGTGAQVVITGYEIADFDPYLIDNDIQGVLSFNSLPPLVGEWELKPYVYADAADVFTKCDSTAGVIVDFLSVGAPGCDGTAVTDCEAGTLDAAIIPAEVCPEIPFSYSVTGITIPNSPVAGGYRIDFDAVPGSGAGGPFGGEPDPSFFLTLGTPGAGAENVDANVTIDNILTTAGGAPAMTGEWVLTGKVVTGGTACDSVPPVTVNFLPDGAPGCVPPPPCEAGSAASVDQTVCPGDDVVLELTGEDFESAADIELVWIFIDTVSDEVFVFPLPSTSPATYNFTGDLNAELALAGLPTLPPGVYLSFAGVFDELTGYCDFTEEASDFFLTILDENDPECAGPPPCTLPYPQVDNSSLTVVENPNGSVTVSWQPIAGQIGCLLNARVGEINNPAVNTNIIVPGPNAGSFTAGAPVLQNYQFATLNFRVRCGCQQNPTVVGGPFTDWVSLFYFGPGSGIAAQQTGKVQIDSRIVSLTPKSQTRDEVSVEGTFPKYVGNVRSIHPDMLDVKLPSNKTERNSFELYPNPSNGAVNVNYTATLEGIVNVRVFDLIGKAVSDKSVAVNKGENFMNLDLSSLEKGVYIVEIMDNGVSSTAKVVLK